MPTTTDIALALDGLRFPATHRDLYLYTKEHDASPEIIEAMHNLPERTFGTIENLFDAMPELE